jgi:hypothetical protein
MYEPLLSFCPDKPLADIDDLVFGGWDNIDIFGWLVSTVG